MGGILRSASKVLKPIVGSNAAAKTAIAKSKTAPHSPNELENAAFNPITQMAPSPNSTATPSNSQNETVQAVMRAWRITPTPENIQNIRSLLTQMQRRSDKAPEDYGAPMHEMQ